MKGNQELNNARKPIKNNKITQKCSIPSQAPPAATPSSDLGGYLGKFDSQHEAVLQPLSSSVSHNALTHPIYFLERRTKADLAFSYMAHH
jgi:hypothetical protein